MSNDNSNAPLSVDRRQLKTLLKTSLRLDWRGTSNPLAGAGQGKITFPPMLGVLVLYLLIGLLSSAAIWKLSEPLTAFVFITSTAMVFVAVSILLEFSNLILSPDDHAIMAPFPVNSKTFFVAKSLHLVIYITILTTALALVPAIMAAVKFKQWWLFPVTSFATWGATTAVAFFFILFYTFMLRLTNREKLNRRLGYLQLFMSFVFYGGNVLLPQTVTSVSNFSLVEVTRGYIYLLPPTWFASWVTALIDGVALPELLASLAGLVSLVGMAYVGVSRLSMDYAITLANIVEQQDSAKVDRKKEGAFSKFVMAISAPEDRVVWRLMLAQFKFDNRYKMSILSLIPLSVFYLFIGSKGGAALIDPFTVAQMTERPEVNYLIYLIIALIPYMVIVMSGYSSHYLAAWVFYTSPADRTRLVLASARSALIFFCIPYLVFMFALCWFFFGNGIHALLHTLILFLLLQALISIMVLILPRLPFSVAVQSGQRVFTAYLGLLLPMPLALIPLFIIGRFGYGGALGYSILFASLLLLTWALRALQRRWIPRRVRKLELVEE